MKLGGTPSLVNRKQRLEMPKMRITELTLLQSLVIFSYAAKHRQQKLDGEFPHAPSGLLGTEPLQRTLAVNIKVGSKSSNSALKQREASHEKKITPFPFILILRPVPGRGCKITNEPEIWISFVLSNGDGDWHFTNTLWDRKIQDIVLSQVIDVFHWQKININSKIQVNFGSAFVPPSKALHSSPWWIYQGPDHCQEPSWLRYMNCQHISFRGSSHLPSSEVDICINYVWWATKIRGRRQVHITSTSLGTRHTSLESQLTTQPPCRTKAC